MNRIECERSGNGMLIKLAKLCLISSKRGKPFIARKAEAYPILFLLYKNVTHEILNVWIILARYKTVNFVFTFIAFNNALTIKKDNF